MRLTVDRTALVDKLNILARGVSTRSALPVLSGVLLQAADGRLDLYATDMELSIKASVTVSAERDGDTVVPARLFSDIVRNLPSDTVDLEGEESALKIKAGRAQFALNAWAAGDFPQTSSFDTAGGLVIGREPFVETLAKVGHAASRDETRPILTGVLVSVAGNVLKMVATDSYRLAVKETRLETEVATEVQAIVPAKALGEVARLASSMGEGDVEVAIGENQAVFRLADPGGGDVYVASRLIDGQFPNYKQLIPESFDHEVVLEKETVVAAARRISLLAQRNAPLRLTFTPGSLTMRALTQDVGQAEETIDVDFQGEEFEIGFNPEFLIDGIEAVDDREVTLKFTNPLRPGLVSGAAGAFVYLIMPIRLSG